MKDDKSDLASRAEQDMLQVLSAEREAEEAIRRCEQDAQQIIDNAQIRVQRIETRANERITNMEMRHSHKLNSLIRNIESEAAAEVSNAAAQHFDEQKLRAVIDKLASELCCGNAVHESSIADDKPETGK